MFTPLRLTSTTLQGSRNWGLVTVLLVVMLLLLMAGVESQVRGMAGRERHTGEHTQTHTGRHIHTHTHRERAHTDKETHR